MTRSCVKRSGWPTVVISCLQQLEADLVAIERNRRHGQKGPAHTLVVIESNDHTLDDLVVFGDLLPYETHVAQHLANDDITGPATLQLDHEQTLLVLADREDIDWPCV